MKTHLEFIHALRSIACLLVVYRHIVDNFWITGLHTSKRYHWELFNFNVNDLFYYPLVHHINGIFSTGAMGVALFFLVSGFVIPLSIQNKSILQFLFARFFRILPVYICCFMITASVMLLYRNLSNHSIGYNFKLLHLLLNIIPLQCLLGAKYFIGVFWTLELEVRFYLITAFYTWLLGNTHKAKHIICLGCIMFACALFRYWTIGIHTNSIFVKILSNHIIYYSPFYLTYMHIGTCFYNHYKGNWTLKKTLFCTSTLLIICMGIFLYYHPLEVRSLSIRGYIHGLLFFSISYFVKHKISCNRFIRWVGHISYPLYLLHSQNGYIIMAIVYQYTSSPYISISVAVFLLCLLSYTVHLFVEEPWKIYGKTHIPHRLCN